MLAISAWPAVPRVVSYAEPTSVLKCSNLDLISTSQQQSLQHVLWFYFKPYTKNSKNSTQHLRWFYFKPYKKEEMVCMTFTILSYF